MQISSVIHDEMRLLLTHSDFASFVGLTDLKAVLYSFRVSALHRQTGLRLAHLAVTHVKRDNVAGVPRRKSTHTGGGVDQAATFPLTDMDLKGPKVTLVENKGAYLIILVVSGKTRFVFSIL